MWERLSGVGVVRGVPGSRGVGFPDFRQQCLDLIGGEAAVGELFQTMGEVESDVAAGSLGAGEHGHDGGDGRATLLGAEMLFTQLQFELQPCDALFELEFHPGNALIAIEQRPVHAFESPGHSLPTRRGKLSQGFLDIGTKRRL